MKTKKSAIHMIMGPALFLLISYGLGKTGVIDFTAAKGIGLLS